MNDNHVTVEFGRGIPVEVQGPVLLRLELLLREQGHQVEVYKRTQPDDSKLRSLMTVEERARL